MSGWQPLSGVPQGSISGLALLNVFINGLEAGIEFTLNEYSHDTKAGGAVDSPEGRGRPYKEMWID